MIEYVKNENYNATRFDYAGNKGGLFIKMNGEHVFQNTFKPEVQDLFYKDQYSLIELQESFISASRNVPLQQALEKIS
jgi:hypothetical protein